MNAPSTGRLPRACNCSRRSCAAFSVEFSCLLAALSLASRQAVGAFDGAQSCSGVAAATAQTKAQAAIIAPAIAFIDFPSVEIVLDAWSLSRCKQLLAPARYAQYRRIGAWTSDDLEIDRQAAFLFAARHRQRRKSAEIDRRRESRQRWRDMHGLAAQLKSQGTAFRRQHRHGRDDHDVGVGEGGDHRLPDLVA